MIPYAIVLAATIISILSLVGIILFSTVLFIRTSRAPRLLKSVERLSGASIDSLITPPLSVIVTARNEEETIAKSLESLIIQDYPELEILVVDDGSEDSTAAIVQEYARKDPRIRLVSAGPKPGGWVGKSWACWRGFEEGEKKSELLLFLDADSCLSPKALGDCVKYFLANGYDMMSISPNVELRGPWAHAIMPFLSGIINLIYPMSMVNDPRSTRAYVFGAFILVRKSVYGKIGGHREVKDRIVEDAAIAENAKKAGYKLRIEIGKEFFSTNWEYRPRQLFHGLERVLTHSIRNYGLVSLLDALLLFFVVLYPIIYLITSALSLLLVHGIAITTVETLEIGLVSSLIAVLVMLFTIAQELHLVTGKLTLYPLLYPLGCTIFIAAIITTTIKMRSGKGIEWKGTAYRQELVART